VITTLFVSTIDVHIEKKNQIHKAKPSKSPEQDQKHDKAINMPKDDH